MTHNNDIIFFRLWRNLVINRVIFKYSRIYRRNRVVKFNGVDELRKYEEREFISELVYKDNYEGVVLIKGDFPEYGILKKLDLSLCCSIITGDIIPNGVECIQYNSFLPVLLLTKRCDKNEIQLSELPLSVSTISNIILKKPYTSNLIPNITSLSFKYVDPIEFYNIKLPNTIVELDIKCISKVIAKLKIVPTVSFIPSSVTNLSIHFDDIFKSKIPKIPSTVNKLCISTCGYCSFDKGVIPYGVKELVINGSVKEYGGIKILKDVLPASITKLAINYTGRQPTVEYNHIIPLSIPSSVTDLTVCFIKYPESYYNIFPCNLTSLSIKTIYKSTPPKISELPVSLKYLKIGVTEINFNKMMV